MRTGATPACTSGGGDLLLRRGGTLTQAGEGKGDGEAHVLTLDACVYSIDDDVDQDDDEQQRRSSDGRKEDEHGGSSSGHLGSIPRTTT